MKFGKVACWSGSLCIGVAAIGLLSHVLAVEPPSDAFDTLTAADLELPLQNLLNDGSEILSEKKAKLSDDDKTRLKQIGNSIAVLALALDVHAARHPMELAHPRPGLVEAGLALAAAADPDEAAFALATAKSASNGNGQGTVRKQWEKIGELKPVMTGVGGSFTSLTRNVKGARLKKSAAKTEGLSASLAAIGQATIFHTEEVKDSKDLELWKQYAGEMRDSAAAVNGAIHAADAEKTATAMTRLNTSCETCHKHFKPEVKGKTP